LTFINYWTNTKDMGEDGPEIVTFDPKEKVQATPEPEVVEIKVPQKKLRPEIAAIQETIKRSQEDRAARQAKKVARNSPPAPAKPSSPAGS
jgi:hypothetical protein